MLRFVFSSFPLSLWQSKRYHMRCNNKARPWDARTSFKFMTQHLSTQLVLDQKTKRHKPGKKTETRQTCFYHWAKSLLNSVYFNWHFCTFKKYSTNHLLLGSMELQIEASCCLTDTDWANYISFWSNHHDLFVSLVTTQFQWRFFYYVMHHIWENVIICLFLPNVMYISCDMLQCASNENTYLVPLNRQILTHLQKTNSHRSNELSVTMRGDTNY